MYAQIAIGCQTQSKIITCEGCFAFNVCKLKQEIGDLLIQKQQDSIGIMRFVPMNQPLLVNQT